MEKKKWTDKHLLLWETKTHSTHNVWPRKQQQPSLYTFEILLHYTLQNIYAVGTGVVVLKKVTSKNQLLLALWDKQNVALRIISKTPTRSTSYHSKHTWNGDSAIFFLGKAMNSSHSKTWRSSSYIFSLMVFQTQKEMKEWFQLRCRRKNYEAAI